LNLYSRHYKEINDKLLRKEWENTEQQLYDEIEEVEKLNEIVLGNKPTRSRKRQQF
jgi:hypothetical protein